MPYQSRHPEAAAHPLRSIALLRSLGVLGYGFLSAKQHADHTRALAVQKLEQARLAIGNAWIAYGDAKAAVGAVNRMARKDRHDRAIYSDRAVGRRRSAAFGTMNKMRGHFLRAYEALAAAEAALLALVVVVN